MLIARPNFDLMMSLLLLSVLAINRNLFCECIMKHYKSQCFLMSKMYLVIQKQSTPRVRENPVSATVFTDDSTSTDNTCTPVLKDLVSKERLQIASVW